MARVRLEFTVEPFVDGTLGPHVRAAIDAVEARGLAVDVGPFSTSADGAGPDAANAVHDLLAAAFDEGATRVSVQVSRLEDDGE